jgi:hypothetical protein
VSQGTRQPLAANSNLDLGNCRAETFRGKDSAGLLTIGTTVVDVPRRGNREGTGMETPQDGQKPWVDYPSCAAQSYPETRKRGGLQV